MVKLTIKRIRRDNSESWYEKRRAKKGSGDPQRKALENLAKNWAAPLGWRFSAPITPPESSIDQLEYTRPTTITVYPGNAYQNSEDMPDSAHITITIGARGEYKAKNYAPTAELKAFYRYFRELKKLRALKDMLTENWTLCQCGYAVHRGERHCAHCDRVNQNHMEYLLYGEVEDNEFEVADTKILKMLAEVGLSGAGEEAVANRVKKEWR